MADVTINQLSEGIPNKNSAVIPYSDGSTTYKTSPSGIVAASPGSVINTIFGQDTIQYDFPDPGPTLAPLNLTSTITVNKTLTSSRLIFNISNYSGGYNASSNAPGVGFHLLYNNNSINVPDIPYIASSGPAFISGTGVILAEHSIAQTGNITYRLGISKNSYLGTGKLVQSSARWIIQEIAA